MVMSRVPDGKISNCARLASAEKNAAAVLGKLLLKRGTFTMSCSVLSKPQSSCNVRPLYLLTSNLTLPLRRLS